MDNTIPEIYGKSSVMEKSHPPSGGPIILPSESKEDSNPVVLPCPAVELFVKRAETLGRITPFPIPNIVK